MSFEETKENYKMIKIHKELKDERFETFFKSLDSWWLRSEGKKEKNNL